VSGEDRTLYLTASRRLARLRCEEHARRARAAGRRAWESPWIYPLQEWALEATAEGTEAPPRLAPAAARALWMRVVRDAGHDDPGPMVTLAAEAWRLVHLYRIGADELEREGSEDTRRFLALARAYGDALSELGFEDEVRALASAPARLRAGVSGRRPKAVVRVGFLRPPPLEDDVFSALEACGVGVRPEPEHPAAAPRLYEAASPEDEWRAAARWFRRRLEDRPEGLFALVVPELGERRRLLERILEEVLEPDGLLAPARRRRLGNVAGGTPLADEPVVVAARLLGRSAFLGLEPPAWSALLLSPYWGGGLHAARWRDELTLRRLPPVRPYTASELANLGLDLEGDLRQRIAAASRAPVTERPRPLAAWIADLRFWLALWGWPGPRIDSPAHQARRVHEEVLDGLLAASAVLGPAISAAEFLLLYEDALVERLFQPEVVGARVLVLEPKDVLGLRLDGLWVAGLHAGAWPPPGHVHPFLPASVARRHGLPRCDVPSALAEARLVDAAWRRVAPEIVYSRAQRDGDLALRPSPLLAGLAPAPAPPEGDDGGLRGRIFARREEVARETVPASEPVPHPDARLAGGSWILGEQALCPFRGWVRRLRIEPLPPFARPIDSRRHGLLLHAALKRLADEEGGWGPHTADRLARRIPEVVAETLAEEGRDPALTPGLAEVEAERLRRLLNAWLELEREVGGERTWDAEVEAGYADRGLELRLRSDRIDREADGRGVVLDYKVTRRPDADRRRYDPSGDEPQPQLWLYALAQRDVSAVGHVVFAGENGPIKVFFVGEEGTRWSTIPGYVSVSDWEERRVRWRALLGRLLEDIRTGTTILAPRGGEKKVCDNCPFPILCRKSSLLELAGTDTEDPP
jgi:ATP-dependent helicase/nuclease subunit B